jgi:hypothetical protein
MANEMMAHTSGVAAGIVCKAVKIYFADNGSCQHPSIMSFHHSIDSDRGYDLQKASNEDHLEPLSLETRHWDVAKDQGWNQNAVYCRDDVQ